MLEAHFSSIDHPLDPDRPPREHLPNAIQVHPSYLEAGTNREKYYPFYNRPLDGNVLKGRELISVLEALGIRPDSHVVVYGTRPDSTMAAARLAWGLMYAGVAKVSLLDGGIDAWISSGGDTVSNIKTVWEVTGGRFRGRRRSTDWRARTGFLATTGEVRELAYSKKPSGKGKRSVDVRKRGEWNGSDTAYYSFFSKAGHIPTAIHQGDWGNLLEAGTQKLRPRLGSVAARWRRMGIIGPSLNDTENSTLIFYCGTGWRSSIAFLVAHLLGMPAKNYDDGFYGWSWDDTGDGVPPSS